MLRTLAILTVLAVCSSPVLPAGTIFGLTTGNGITVFDSASPGVAIRSGSITGLASGETVRGIDFRPATRSIYLLSDNSVYTLNRSTFAASLVGSGFSARLLGNDFGFDFNPAFRGGEFARIISDTDQNRVVSGDTGDYLPPVEKTAVFYAAGDPNDGVDPNITAIAYTNSVSGATSTQQYGIDTELGVLTTVANNAGTLVTVGSLGLGTGLGSDVGLDISGDTGTAFASIGSELYTISLGTGAATSVGTIAGDSIRDITAVNVPEPGTVAIFAGICGCAFLRRRRGSRLAG